MSNLKSNIVYNDLWARKSSGFLIPLFSIRTTKSLGIGDIGDLFPLIDWAAQKGQKIIQLLPINDTSPGDASPYAAISTYAANPLYLNIDMIYELEKSKGRSLLLKEWALDGTLDIIRDSKRVDYKAVRAVKMGLLAECFDHFYREEWEHGGDMADELLLFIENEKKWLLDYALFRVLKEEFGDKEWRTWPHQYRCRNKDALISFERKKHERFLFYKWLQWVFVKQWNEMRAYAHNKGVYLMGDVAFYPGIDSVDVWANPQLFHMEDDFSLSATSGAPPDYFNPDGQNWGTPLYYWDAMESDDFSWWCNRIERTCAFFDLYRLDHFRGFESYWKVPAGSKASFGNWVKAPGEKLLAKLLNISLYDNLLIPLAEDLGDITPEVHEMRKQLGIAGYKTFIFGWGEGEESGKASGYRYPEDYSSDFLATTGTHDTPTLSEWWEEIGKNEREVLLRYLSLPYDISYDCARRAILTKIFNSKALFVVLPIQDILGLGPEERINLPGTFGEHNWSWRMPITIERLLAGTDKDFSEACKHLKALTFSSERAGSLKYVEKPTLVALIPSQGMVQVRKKGEHFVIWAAFNGKADIVRLRCSLLRDDPLDMTQAEVLSSGIVLYYSMIEAKSVGTYSMEIYGGNIAETVKIIDCLKVRP